MNDELKPTEYLILFRSTNWNRDLSPREMQQVMERTYAWFDSLKADGKLHAAQPLFHEGRVLQGHKDGTITDGPFAESKEMVGGYLIIHAGSLDEATEIARGWPLLRQGSAVEVRPIAAECPDFYKLRQQPDLASA